MCLLTHVIKLVSWQYYNGTLSFSDRLCSWWSRVQGFPSFNHSINSVFWPARSSEITKSPTPLHLSLLSRTITTTTATLGCRITSHPLLPFKHSCATAARYCTTYCPLTPSKHPRTTVAWCTTCLEIARA